MHVRLRLFAALRQRAGADALDLELPAGARVSDALAQLDWLTQGIPVVMAVNHEYADAEQPLSEDDELALIPPVSGGSVGTVHARISDTPLSLDRLVAA